MRRGDPRRGDQRLPAPPRHRRRCRRGGCRRTEQHLARVRLSADPEAVPPHRPGPNPDVEIGESPHDESAFRRAPQVAGAIEYAGAGRSRRISRCCSSSSRARPTAGRTRSTSSAASTKTSRSRRAAPDPLPAATLFDLAAPSAAGSRDVDGGYLDSAQPLGRRTGGTPPRAVERYRAERLRAPAVHGGTISTR